MRAHVLAILLLTALAGHAAEVVCVTWPTAEAAPAVKLQPPAADLLPAFRFAIGALPESSITALALSQPSLLGLTTAEAARLQPLTSARYRLMAQSPDYSQAASALPYCFSDPKPATGWASIYVPTGATAKTPVILFLHGYGGSFLWYQHYLSESFPMHIIICPAYGISTASIPQTYVAESIRAAAKRLGFPISPPCLVGLSAGGFGACRLYAEAPRAYTQLICLAACPPDDTLARFARDSHLHFLAGGEEFFVSSGDFRHRIDRIRAAGTAVKAATIRGGDHFFLLTHPKESVDQLRQWIPAVP